jgi:hypothetical protein
MDMCFVQDGLTSWSAQKREKRGRWGGNHDHQEGWKNPIRSLVVEEPIAAAAAALRAVKSSSVRSKVGNAEDSGVEKRVRLMVLNGVEVAVEARRLWGGGRQNSSK